MPSQTVKQKKSIWFYGKDDTFPALADQLTDDEGNPVDLSSAESVHINIAHSTYDAYFSPGYVLVENGLCTIVTDPINTPGIGQEKVDKFGADGWVTWLPQPEDLDVVGHFSFVFLVKWGTDLYSTHKSLSYHFIKVQAPPYANSIPRT